MNTAADYLARLDDALRDVPHGIASEIRAGVAEELQSLPPDAAQARIAQLGEPAEIAREAIAAGGYAPATPAPAAVPTPSAVPVTRTRGFAIAAALTLSFGGFVLPVAGWVAGAVLVCLSAMWRAGEKAVAIVVPLVTGGLSLFAGLTMWGFTAQVSSGSSTGSGPAPEVANPLVPAWYDLMFSGAMLIGILLIPASGLWLLWRMRGRTAPVGEAPPATRA